MKVLTCEMCGSTNLIKQNGVFICQSCSTKYSVDEAKKMMVEGSVTINKSPEIKNLIHLCNSSLEMQNYYDAEMYATRIVELDSTNYCGWLLRMKASCVDYQDLHCHYIISYGKEALKYATSDEDILMVYKEWLNRCQNLLEMYIDELRVNHHDRIHKNLRYRKEYGDRFNEQVKYCADKDTDTNLALNNLQEVVSLRYGILNDHVSTYSELHIPISKIGRYWKQIQIEINSCYNDYSCWMSDGLLSWFKEEYEKIMTGVPEAARKECDEIQFNTGYLVAKEIEDYEQEKAERIAQKELEIKKLKAKKNRYLFYSILCLLLTGPSSFITGFFTSNAFWAIMAFILMCCLFVFCTSKHEGLWEETQKEMKALTEIT